MKIRVIRVIREIRVCLFASCSLFVRVFRGAPFSPDTTMG